MGRKTITALMVAPGVQPCVIELYQGMEFLKTVVSIGLEETDGDLSFHKIEAHVGVLFCQFAILWNGKINCKVDDHVLAGVFYVVGVEGNRLTSLSPADIERYKKRFWVPLKSGADGKDDMNGCFDTLFSKNSDAAENLYFY